MPVPTPDPLALPAEELRALLVLILAGEPLPPGARGVLVLEVLRLLELERTVIRRPGRAD